MVFSNLALQWCNDPDRVLRDCRRVLRPGGVLHFSDARPGHAASSCGKPGRRPIPAHVHVNRFIDMHDLGDALGAGRALPSRCSTSNATRSTYDDARA